MGTSTDGGEVAERMIGAKEVELCTESFGDPAHPAILLVAGLGSSMLWWDEQFCRMLADGHRFIIRYDHRDTGRSHTCQPGRPDYDGDDLVDDAVRVMDAYDLPAAHVVGVSAGGGIAQLLAIDLPDRVLSLVLISTSPATPGDRGLPAPAEEFGRFVAAVEADWSSPESVTEYLVDYSRVLAGNQRFFDEQAVRELIRRDLERARDIAALQNHDVIPDGQRSRGPVSSIRTPTLVLHGTADPMFPIEHGQGLAAEITGATLVILDGAGHGVDRADWAIIVPAILDHTSAAS
jgi:pimeloyl-ACP methyl ester carboxylesterase